MTPLEARLRARIREHGAITVAEYMASALGDPDHGYYRGRDPLGVAGDFVTAPEISQVFGELVGVWCIAAWRQMGEPTPFLLIELGPGRGTLMADVLRIAGAHPGFLKALEVHLVETSPGLRDAQERALAGHAPYWHDTVETVADGPALIVANEFFDALPVEQFVRREDGWRRRRVAVDPDTGALAFVAAERVEADTARFPDPAPLGAVFETSPEALSLAARLGTRLARDGGAALIVDYGHTVTAAGETLQAVAQHRYHDVLADAGAADLTAHVDFEALGAAARGAGAAVYGPVTQGELLARLGIAIRERALTDGATPEVAERVRSGCRRLTDPDQMGTLFKALALAHPALPVPAGFAAEGPAA